MLVSHHSKWATSSNNRSGVAALVLVVAGYRAKTEGTERKPAELRL